MSKEQPFDYPKEYVETAKRLRAIHSEYEQAIKLDRPEGLLSDIMMRIGAELYYIQRWVAHYRKLHAELDYEVKRDKTKAYEGVLKDEEITRSGKIDHVRWLFREAEGELDLLDALVRNMWQTYSYYNDLRTMIQSIMRQSNTEKVLEGK